MKQTVLIIMPAYNEGPRIRKVIESIPRRIAVGERKFDTKVVVIDDCSTDNTADEARKAGVNVLQHVMNSGAGAATRTGLRYAMYQHDDLAFVATIDSDGQHTVKDVEHMIAHAIKSGADMIVGNRLHAGNKADMPFHRVFGNVGLTLISRALFGIKTKDTQSGLRLYRPEALPAVAEYTIDRFGFCTEMLWLALRAGLRVDEVPIAVKYFDETLRKGQNNWGVVLLVKDLLWIRFAS